MALFTKIALLSILIRIFKPYKGKILFIYILLGALTVYYIIAEGIKLGMCQPVSAFWTQDPNAFCLDQQAALVADSVISVVTDLIILILPLPLTWSLQMPLSKKLRVIGMLSAGGLATAFSIYRLVLVITQGASNDMSIVFICVVMSGYVAGLPQQPYPTNTNKAQKRRRRCRFNLRLPSDIEYPDQQHPKTRLRLQLQPLLQPTRILCASEQDEGCQQQGLLGHRIKERSRDRVWVGSEPPDHICGRR